MCVALFLTGKYKNNISWLVLWCSDGDGDGLRFLVLRLSLFVVRFEECEDARLVTVKNAAID